MIIRFDAKVYAVCKDYNTTIGVFYQMKRGPVKRAPEERSILLKIYLTCSWNRIKYRSSWKAPFLTPYWP